MSIHAYLHCSHHTVETMMMPHTLMTRITTATMMIVILLLVVQITGAKET
jgi:hypothetical protein